jgi:hypothetical protein
LNNLTTWASSTVDIRDAVLFALAKDTAIFSPRDRTRRY